MESLEIKGKWDLFKFKVMKRKNYKYKIKKKNEEREKKIYLVEIKTQNKISHLPS